MFLFLLMSFISQGGKNTCKRKNIGSSRRKQHKFFSPKHKYCKKRVTLQKLLSYKLWQEIPMKNCKVLKVDALNQMRNTAGSLANSFISVGQARKHCQDKLQAEDEQG